MFLLSCPVKAYSGGDFTSGSGSQEDPFLITNSLQLINLRKYLGNEFKNFHFKLANDIDLDTAPSDSVWLSIGYYKSDAANSAFEGTFDGNYKIISHINVSDTTGPAGLFGYCKGSILNLILDSISIKGSSFTGGLCGIVDDHNCKEPICHKKPVSRVLSL